jgi:hypothetical protein
LQGQRLLRSSAAGLRAQVGRSTRFPINRGFVMSRHGGVSTQESRTRAPTTYDRARMEERIASLETPEACEKFVRNASRLDRPDLAVEARKRAVRLRAAGHGGSSAAELQCLEAVFAREEVLTNKNGRRTRAFRAWQMIKQHGILAATERLVQAEPNMHEYRVLVEFGLTEFAFEAVVLRHPTLFSDAALSIARSRIAARAHGATQ